MGSGTTESSLLAGLPIPVIVRDLQGRVLFENAASRELAGGSESGFGRDSRRTPSYGPLGPSSSDSGTARGAGHASLLASPLRPSSLNPAASPRRAVRIEFEGQPALLEFGSCDLLEKTAADRSEPTGVGYFVSSVTHQLRNHQMVLMNSEYSLAAVTPREDSTNLSASELQSMVEGARECLAQSRELIECLGSFLSDRDESTVVDLNALMSAAHRLVEHNYMKSGLELEVVPQEVSVKAEARVGPLKLSVIEIFAFFSDKLPVGSRLEVRVEEALTPHIQFKALLPAEFEIPSTYFEQPALERIKRLVRASDARIEIRAMNVSRASQAADLPVASLALQFNSYR